MTGEVTFRVLEERALPVRELRLFASRRSVGRRVAWRGQEYTVFGDGADEDLTAFLSRTGGALSGAT